MFTRGGSAVIDPLRLGETKTPGHRIADLRVGNSSIHTVASPSPYSSSSPLGHLAPLHTTIDQNWKSGAPELAITSPFIVLLPLIPHQLSS